MIHDCIIVGAGPAGITAAIQIKRSGCGVLLFEKDGIGGLLRNARMVENFPGFPGGISGVELTQRLQKQLEHFAIGVVPAEVERITQDSMFTVHTTEGKYVARAVIVATGTKPKKAGIRGEEELAGERVFYEIADLPLLESGKTVLIIGGGDCGFDYALNLHDRGHHPVIVTRVEAQCLPLLRKEVEERGIPYHEHVIPEEIREEGSGVVVLGSGQRFPVDAVLIAVGREPNLPPMPREAGGLHIVGDARGGPHRQVCIAAGGALCAAMKVAERLRKTP